MIDANCILLNFELFVPRWAVCLWLKTRGQMIWHSKSMSLCIVSPHSSKLAMWYFLHPLTLNKKLTVNLFSHTQRIICSCKVHQLVQFTSKHLIWGFKSIHPMFFGCWHCTIAPYRTV